MPPVDSLNDASPCGSYTLPTLTNGNYFTGTGGTGTALNAGNDITSTQTIYIYADNGTCSNETSFTITIIDSPIVDVFSDVTANNEYVLPPVTIGDYYTGAGATGAALNAGDIISSSQTIYIYAINGVCYDESSFPITITHDFIYPRVFTPNGDGYHDTWGIENNTILNGNPQIYIYDRYGKLIKVIRSNIEFWDGTYNQNDFPADDYWFSVQAQNGKVYKGHFNLKR